jgi:hypothetical protein
MASSSNKDSGAVHADFWVGAEPLEAVSLFSSNGATKWVLASFLRLPSERI